jgi:filamentous hemagglutinin family protein
MRSWVTGTAVLCTALQPPLAFALPEGGTVVAAGQAVIASQADRLDVTQASARALIDWDSFNIHSGESVQFNQPSSSAVALNRIHDANPSSINGNLHANGQVWLVNRNGIMFGAGAQVNVAGLLATTSDIANDDFMNGNYQFTIPGNPTAVISNAGQITVRDGGLAALAGPNVTNIGLIEARLGRVQLASGDTFALDLYHDGLISLAASDAITQQLVSNSGGIQADGGSVLLTAAAARNAIDSLINLDGLISADSIAEHDGKIILYAGGNGGTSTTLVAGSLQARGSEPSETGGRIEVLGDRVGILAGATVDASGNAGGGTVLIGGDYQGGGVTPRAGRVIVQAGSNIFASGLENGDGGKAIVWADERTDFAGNIEAKGGPTGGDGGFVETSGNEILVATGTVDASSPWGLNGLWLLDPNNITINTTADTNVSSSGAGPVVWDTTDDSAIVTVASILASLNAGTSVTVQTGTAGANAQAGNITVGADIAKTAGGDATLLLKARNDIIVGGNVDITSSSNKLHVTLNADSDASNAGGILMNSGSAIHSNGGNIVLGGGADPTATAAYGGVSITIGVDLAGASLSAAGGNVSIRGNGRAAGSNKYGVFVRDGTAVSTTGAGTITIVGTGGGSAAGGSNYGITVYNSSVISAVDGAISLTGTGGASTGGTNDGIFMLTSGTVQSTGSGAITLTGIAGGGASTGISTSTGSNVIGGGSAAGNITLNADTLSIANLAIQTAGNVTIAPNAAATTIGVAGAAGTLQVTSGILDAISANTTILGLSGGSGLMRMQGADLSAESYNLALLNGSGIIQLDGVTTLLLAANKSFGATTTTGNITTGSAATITTSGTGGVTLDPNGAGIINPTHALTLNSGSGGIGLAGAVTLGAALVANAGTGTLAFGSTVNGAHNLTGTAGAITYGGDLGSATPLAAVSLTSTNTMTLPSITADTIFVRTMGAASDMTITSGKTLTASGANDALTLVAGRNFVNNAGGAALSTPAGRWLVYSTSPASDNIGGLTSAFTVFSCTYGGACPGFPGVGNGLLYSAAQASGTLPNFSVILNSAYVHGAHSGEGNHAFLPSDLYGSDPENDEPLLVFRPNLPWDWVLR